ncbi:hypothetical protein G9U51_12670 [Calidifontibacter sp. DB0510]|uniref:DUF559 domain-containing protein n=1 Tax=Metallococcus carri TaxID=1656884 RepID=A0A967B280_9MICO|nr:hypothetical protein [Metallococcus carri]NHN56634.1 hypothetical protein [Metallococcus carri]NOP38933.1 hypothetical protein [Calidifontibacter sp. DB2511S]
MTTRDERLARRARVEAVARCQGGLVSRRQLAELAVSRAAIRAELDAHRWEVRGAQTVAAIPSMHGDDTTWWHAVLEVGRTAALDGVTALAAAGLSNFDDELVHVSVPRFEARLEVPGVLVHNINRRTEGELDGGPLPCVGVGVAAIRAAGWARSNAQAALVMVMAVQQRLLSGEQLMAAAASTRTRARRAFIQQMAFDIGNGAQSMGELDFAQLCREYGLPEPERQALCHGPNGRVYLDVRWPCGLVVEIDGIHHGEGLNPINDALRQNHVVLQENRVLRIPLMGLRLQPDAFMRQVVLALQMCGGLPT